MEQRYGAFTAYSTGLSAMDNGDKKGAQKAFEQAKSIDPNFALADDYLNQLGVKAKSTLARAKAAQGSKLDQLASMVISDASLNCDAIYALYGQIQGEYMVKFMDGANKEEANRYYGLHYQSSLISGRME